MMRSNRARLELGNVSRLIQIIGRDAVGAFSAHASELS